MNKQGPYYQQRIALLLAIPLLFSACKDEYSYERRPFTDTSVTLSIDSTANAHFALIGAPDTCMSALVTGTYRSGDSLTLLNTIVLQVNVSSSGIYAITTDTLNGMYFSAAGRFDQIGSQTLVLTGKGTPLEAGTYAFTLHTTGMQCRVYVPVEAPPAPAVYKFKIDPDNHCADPVIQGTYTAGSLLETSNLVSIEVDVETIGVFTIKTPEENGMTFSYSGFFIRTGRQFVRLQGMGMPQQAGTFSFMPRIVGMPLTIGTGCIFSIAVQ